MKTQFPLILAKLHFLLVLIRFVTGNLKFFFCPNNQTNNSEN